MKVKIKSFNGVLPEYLTEGKEYECSKICDEFYTYITADDGDGLMINIHDCEYLNGGSWQVLNEN